MKAVGLTPRDLQDALTTMQKSAEGIIGQSVGKANEALQDRKVEGFFQAGAGVTRPR